MPDAPNYCFLAIDWWPVCMQKSEWASWVQAVGSIAAIGLGIWVVQKQHRLELARQRATEAAAQRSLREAAFQLVGAVYQLANKAIRMAEEGDRPSPLEMKHLALEFEGVAGALARVDHLRFDSYAFVEPLLIALSCARKMLHVLEFAIDREQAARDGGIRRSFWPSIGEQAFEVVDPLRERMDAMRAVLDGG